MGAVLTVVLGHVAGAGPAIHPELDGFPFRLTVRCGAASLMVISAFFVCVTIRRGDPRRWLRGRLARLLPVYFVAALLTYAVTRFAVASFNGLSFAGGPVDVLFGDPVSAAAHGTGWGLPAPSDLLASVAMVVPWTGEFSWVDPSYWTMPVQVLAFVVAALLWPRAWRRGAGLYVLLWALIVVPLFIRFVLMSPEGDPAWANSLFYGLGLPRARLFAAGVAIWLYSRGRLSRPHLATLLVTTVLAEYFRGSETHLPSMIGFALMLLVIVRAAGGPDWHASWLRPFIAQIRWLAGISFGMYLVQQQLGYVLARVLVDLGLGPGTRLLTVLAAVVAGGWLLTVLVERPAHRWLTRRAPAARPAPSTVPP